MLIPPNAVIGDFSLENFTNSFDLLRLNQVMEGFLEIEVETPVFKEISPQLEAEKSEYHKKFSLI